MMSRKAAFALGLILLAAALAACGASGGTATPSPMGPLPDLVVSQVRIQTQTIGCADRTLGTRVVVGNVGDADAGPFTLQVNGKQETISGLAAGQAADRWFEGYASGEPTQVYVDANLQVVESNEENNSFIDMLPIPTLLPPCTPATGG